MIDFDIYKFMFLFLIIILCITFYFHKKFGKVSEKGYIVAPNRLTLKWIPNFYFRIVSL